MAKKKDVNKAEEIRKYMNAHPATKGVDIVAALKKQGITVHPTQVSNVKAQVNKKAMAGERADRAELRAAGQLPGRPAKSATLGFGDKIKAALALLGVATKAEARDLIDHLPGK